MDDDFPIGFSVAGLLGFVCLVIGYGFNDAFGPNPIFGLVILLGWILSFTGVIRFLIMFLELIIDWVQ